MKKILQRIATLCFLASWIIIGMAAHHPGSLKCDQEWKAALNNNSGLAKEEADGTGSKEQMTNEDSEMMWPGRAISFLQ